MNIMIINNQVEFIRDVADFADLLLRSLGPDAAQYFLDIVDELEEEKDLRNSYESEINDVNEMLTSVQEIIDSAG